MSVGFIGFGEAGSSISALLNESLPGIDWQRLADYMVGRVVLHGERRAREMEEAPETLRAIGVEPIMAEVTARRQASIAGFDLRSRFGPGGPTTAAEVVEAMDAGRGAGRQ